MQIEQTEEQDHLTRPIQKTGFDVSGSVSKPFLGCGAPTTKIEVNLRMVW